MFEDLGLDSSFVLLWLCDFAVSPASETQASPILPRADATGCVLL